MNRPAVHPLTLGQRIVELDRTYLMGIVNCTPDSFSDGGQLTDSDAAIRHAEQLVADGAEILDVGGESTRPGAAEVPAEIELRRVLPVVNALARAGHMVSIDTRKPIVARRAVDAGAVMINDVGGLREREMIDLAATTKVAVIVMHMRGNPADMQQYASYTDVVAEVADFLLTQVSRAVAHGVRREQLLLDPGIGFAKTLDHNLSLLKHLRELTSLGHAVVVGTSRKAFIGTLTDRPVDDREFGTAATLAMAVDRGAQILRVHNVRRAREVVNVSEAVRNAAFC
ncbi:MAG: dihydropteroate synthase [Myxococcales bacterium]|nr:dihydropteroate synthase [Myxococcales bacterium]